MGPRDRALIWLYVHVTVGQMQRLLCFLLRIEATAPAPTARAVFPMVEAAYLLDAVARTVTWDQLSDEAQDAVMEAVCAYLRPEARHS